MAEPKVVTTLREFQEGILSQESAQFEEMARRWRELERELQGDLDSVALEIQRLKANGQTVRPSLVARQERYQRLIARAEEQVELYVQYADELISRRQQELGHAGLSHAATALGIAGAPIGLASASIEDLEDEIGRAGNGETIEEVLRSRMVRDDAGNPLPEVAGLLAGTLSMGVAAGWTTNRVTGQMRNDMARGLTTALGVARTEQVRTYGTAHVLQYRKSGLVEGVLRLPAHNRNTCAACLADEGTFYPLVKKVPDHVNGRCASIPKLKNVDAPRWTGGEEWFMQQDESMQSSILGPGRLQAYKEGKFGFPDLVTHKDDPEWGESIVPTPLYKLTNE